MSLDFKQLGPLFELSREAVVAVEDGSIVFCNPAAEQLLNARVGQPAEELLPPALLESRAERMAASLPLGGITADVTALRMGETVVYNLRAREDARRGTPLGSRRVFADSLSTLRMALDGLLGRCDGKQDPQLQRYATVLYRQYYTLLRLCSHLSLAENLANGSQPLALRTVDLEEVFGELCRSAALLCAESLNTELSFRAEPALYLSAADPELLELMLLNLLANSLQQRRGGHIRVTLRAKENRFLLSVDDDGRGIPAQALPQLFAGEPSLENAHNGAGLGLRIARGIAELHGGSLLLESRLDEGSALRITLPKKESLELSLHMPHPRYGNDGLHRLLTELAPLLPDEVFGKNFSD